MLYGIFGRRGCGKTRLMIECVYHLAKRGRMILAYDPVHQFPDQFRIPFADIEGRSRLQPIVAVSDCEPDEILNLAIETGDITVACDEFDLVCSANTWHSEAARTIVRRGRHYRVGLIATGQRFVNVHGDFLALANRISIFQTQLPADLQRVEKHMGSEYSTTVARLEPYSFVTWGSGEGRVSRLGGGGYPPLDEPLTVT